MQPFPNYMQMEQPVPMRVWHTLRAVSVGCMCWLIGALLFRPAMGLLIFWKILVPVLPVVFFAAPGLWRNTCPLAAVNQAPRLFGFSRARPLPHWLREYGYIIGMALFFVAVPLRKLLFNESGLATGLLIVSAALFAFIGGLLFKGKGGWCSNICPLLPTQRLYGQTPFAMIPNSHCQPCVGCTKNCYDFNPAVAYLADQYDEDRHYSGYRRFFAGAFPGMILAYFLLPTPAPGQGGQMLLRFLTYMGLSIASFHLLESFVKVSGHKITALYAMLALNLYYWFSLPALARTLESLLHLPIPALAVYLAQAALLVASGAWLVRTYRKERLFVAETLAAPAVKFGAGALKALAREQKAQAELTVKPQGQKIALSVGRTLLEGVESARLPIEAGCRMGMCGADPVCVLEGSENLSAITQEERTTLERLGLSESCRLACCARIQGHVQISLTPERAAAPTVQVAAAAQYDSSIKRVVIIGNGVAGVTAADHIRRRHPACEIHIIGRERHHLYNRMAITRLIYGQSAMQGLYLLPDSWYEERQIRTWLNTQAVAIEIAQERVMLGVGEALSYDRLILAMGSAGYLPPIPGLGVEGTFVLREAEDAMAIRAYVQNVRARQAVVAGGGLLGLEAAYALHKLGLEVTVLERSEWLLRRQLDQRASEILQQYLRGLGLKLYTQANTQAVEGERRVRSVLLTDGRRLPCDLFLACAGIQPNIGLAAEAGLAVRQGILVDDQMQTSVPHIYAVGDLAEHRGQIYGLWAAAVEQAEAAAINALGGTVRYSGTVPETMLKVVGADLVSIGRFEPQSPTEEVIVQADGAQQRYRKLVIEDGRPVGAILLGYPQYTPAVSAAIKQKRDVRQMVEALRTGNWEPLVTAGQEAAL